MKPQRTAPPQPVALRIADDLRIAIETERLAPGDSLPTLSEITAQYRCSTTTARNAIALLKQQGLITGGRGRAPVVRGLARRVERSSLRHQVEKDLVLADEATRAKHGLAEEDMDSDVEEFDVEVRFSEVSADADLASAFEVQEGTALLRREFHHREKERGTLAAWSLSWLPIDVIASNPAISDPANAKWPGGTLHQLYTVGIEVDRVIDHVTAAMPTTVEAQAWNLQEGIPLLWVRRISIDTTGRVVEVSDAQYPANRTMLTFHTQLKRWEHTP